MAKQLDKKTKKSINKSFFRLAVEALTPKGKPKVVTNKGKSTGNPAGDLLRKADGGAGRAIPALDGTSTAARLKKLGQ